MRNYDSSRVELGVGGHERIGDGALHRGPFLAPLVQWLQCLFQNVHLLLECGELQLQGPDQGCKSRNCLAGFNGIVWQVQVL